MKTISVEKARENYEKALERVETLREKLDTAEKHLRKCEAVLTESENAEYVRIVREMNISIKELREIRKGWIPQTVLLERMNEEENQNHEQKPGENGEAGNKEAENEEAGNSEARDEETENQEQNQDEVPYESSE